MLRTADEAVIDAERVGGLAEAFQYFGWRIVEPRVGAFPAGVEGRGEVPVGSPSMLGKEGGNGKDGAFPLTQCGVPNGKMWRWSSTAPHRRSYPSVSLGLADGRMAGWSLK
jgi:hypothetical protein